jgi:hypothetical protein
VRLYLKARQRLFAVRRKIRHTAKIYYRAFCMTHDKEAICRAPDKRRMVKI